MAKSKREYTFFKLRGAVYGNMLPKPMVEKDAKKWIKEHLDVERMPKGTEMW